MKKVFGFLMVTILLASCGSQFSRSKYDRHMWNRSQGKTEKELKPTEEESKSDVSEKTFSQGNEKSNIQTVANEDAQSLAVSKTDIITEEKKETKKVSVRSSIKQNHSSNGMTALPQLKKNSLKKKFQEMKSNNRPGNPTQDGGDTNLILLVILAIILPPLGVYLADGSVTGLFWLTLILCLIGGGGIFGVGIYFAGLYGLAAILALLRVFGII